MKNVRMEPLGKTIQMAKADPSALEIRLNLEGEWRMDESLPQFGGAIKLPSGETVMLESDFPPFLGGAGRNPSPLQYCFWGGMACFGSILAVIAAQEKIEIESLRIRTKGTIDFSQPLGLSQNPPIHGLTWEVMIKSSASEDTLDRLVELAEERCPASWMMRNIVPLKTIRVTN